MELNLLKEKYKGYEIIKWLSNLKHKIVEFKHENKKITFIFVDKNLFITGNLGSATFQIDNLVPKDYDFKDLNFEEFNISFVCGNVQKYIFSKDKLKEDLEWMKSQARDNIKCSESFEYHFLQCENQKDIEEFLIDFEEEIESELGYPFDYENINNSGQTLNPVFTEYYEILQIILNNIEV